jgi:transcriptional regulator with XRE-family HTH domain
MRDLRRSKKITMKELGRIVGVSESTISLYETGKHEPDLQTMGRIADALSVSVDELLGRDPGIKKEAPESGLDDRLVEMLVNLSPDQVQRVMDFVAGMKAADKA